MYGECQYFLRVIPPEGAWRARTESPIAWVQAVGDVLALYATARLGTDIHEPYGIGYDVLSR
jgi:hypothetical protein